MPGCVCDCACRRETTLYTWQWDSLVARLRLSPRSSTPIQLLCGHATRSVRNRVAVLLSGATCALPVLRTYAPIHTRCRTNCCPCTLHARAERRRLSWQSLQVPMAKR